MSNKEDVSLARARGFDAGNYANAYEREELPTDEEIEREAGRRGCRYFKKPFLNGYILGFFSSYELHEIPEEHRERVRLLREREEEE